MLRWLSWVALGGVVAIPIADVLVRMAPLVSRPLGAATLLRAVGLCAGAAGIGLLAVVIVLGLRSPLLERTLGPLGRLIRIHHVLGVAAYALILVHPLALAAALAASSSAWASARMLFGLDRAAIALGWLAVVSLMLVVVSSFVGRPTHETWRRLHALGWIGGMLGVAHAFAVRGLRGSHVVLAGVLLAAAFEKTVELALFTARYRVDRVRRLPPGIVEVELVPLRRSIRFRPGQFAFVRFRDPRTGWRCREYHPFTVASGLLDDRLRLSIKQLGDCTRTLLDIREGALADMRGPFGSLFEGATAAPRQIWLAGGMGIAPFLSAARSLSGQAPSVHLFYCTKRASDAVYLHELEGLAMEQPSLRVHHHVEEGEGLLTAQQLLSEAGDGQDAEFFIAGPPAFSAALRGDLIAHHVAPHRIHSETFEHL